MRDLKSDDPDAKVDSHRLGFTLPTKFYLLESNTGNTRKRCEICSKLTIESLLITLTIFQALF